MQNAVLWDRGGGTNTGGGIAEVVLVHVWAKPLQRRSWKDVGAAKLDIRMFMVHGGDRERARGRVIEPGSRPRLRGRGRRGGISARIRGKTDLIVAHIIF